MRAGVKEKRPITSSGGVRFAVSAAKPDLTEEATAQLSSKQTTEGDAFADADFALVVPPLNYAGKAVEYCRLLVTGQIEGGLTARRPTEDDASISGDEGGEEIDGQPFRPSRRGRSSVVVNQRQSLLQGELLDVAAVVTALSDEVPGEAWFEKYTNLKATADLTVISNPETDVASNSFMGTRDGSKATALSSQLWEAQAFPIDAPDHVSVTVHRREADFCVIYAFQIPLTINPKHLEKPLSLQVTLGWQDSSSSGISSGLAQGGGGSLVNSGGSSEWSASLAGQPSLPLSGVFHSDLVKETKKLQEVLQAPTPYISLAVPYSSALTGGLWGSKGAGDTYNLPWYDTDGQFTLEGDQKEENTISRNIELLDLAVVQPALRDSTRLDYPVGWPGDEENVMSCIVDVQKPLNLSTTLIDTLMYMQIENITSDTSVTIENIHIRSVNTFTQGELPFELSPGEQYSLLLCPDEELLNSQASIPTWDAIKSRGGATMGGVVSPAGPKKVLPLCLKWRMTDSHGPSVWSQFGADCQLPARTPLEVSITCLSCSPPGGTLTAVLTVTNHEAQEVEITVFLPKDLLYHKGPGQKVQQPALAPSVTAAQQQDPPPLIPLVTRRSLGRIAKSASQSTHLQFLTTRVGLHSFPPVMILDSSRNRRFIARGGQVVVN